MSPIRGKPACSLTLLIQRAAFLNELRGEPAGVVLGGKYVGSLLRHHLERRSDTEFLNELCRDFQIAGFSEGKALACLHKVVNAPGVALTRKRKGSDTEILQAALLREDDAGDDAYLVIVRVTIAVGKPPQVIDASTESVPLNISGDLTELVRYLEEWWREFRVREITLPEMSKPKTFLWLGDPRAAGYSDVPADWQTQLRTTASVLGMRTQMATDADQLRSRRSQLFATGDVVMLLHGWRPGRKALNEENFAQGALIVGTPGSSFSDLRAAVRHGLVRIATEADAEDAYRPRELLPGETVYHRKVGTSDKFDHFDAGTSEPCNCNKKYVPWDSAPKASKGMARRYSNFHEKDVYLKHCSGFPNCGMYAVERRGPRLGAD